MSTQMNNRLGWRQTPLSRMPKGQPDGGRIGGVVAGVSRAYGFDLTTTRIAVVVSTIILPVIALLYLAAWVLLPPSPAQAEPITSILRDRRRMPILMVIGLLLVMGTLGSLGSWFLFRGAPWGLVLIALGVLLWMTSTRQAPPPTTPAPVPDEPAVMFPPPTDASPETTPWSAFAEPTVTAPKPARERRARRPRRPIASIGVGIAMLWVAAAAALEALGWWSPTALWVIVAALGIVMVSLLVSTIVNHSWLLPFPLLAVGGVVVALCVAQPDLDGPTGSQTVRPDTVATAEQRHHLAAGQLRVDLRNVPFAGADGPVQVEAEVGMGRLEVLVPEDSNVQILTDVGMGQAQLDGVEFSSGARQTNVIGDPPQDGTFELDFVLDLRVGMGQIDVSREAAEASFAG